jgi:hypothetical protein
MADQFKSIGRVLGISPDLVRDSHASEEDGGQHRLSNRAALVEKATEEFGPLATVCLCCGTWWKRQSASALPSGSAWSPYVDTEDDQELLAWRHLGGNLSRYWQCVDCGSVFVETGEVRYKSSVRSLSLLRGLRIASDISHDELHPRARGLG